MRATECVCVYLRALEEVDAYFGGRRGAICTASFLYEFLYVRFPA